MRLITFGSVLLSATATVSAGLLERPDFINHYQFRRQVAVSQDGNCGDIDGVATTCLGSVQGDCCSRLGYCGGNSSYCGDGCQSDYGTCGDANISTDGSCGGSKGLTCIGFALGSCCSEKGFCGATEDYCGTGCQQNFGECSTAGAAGPKATATSSGSDSKANSTSPTDIDSAKETQNNSGGDAAPALSEDKDDNDNNALKVGLGIGIPVGLLAIGGLCAFIFFRRRKQAPQEIEEKAVETPVQHELAASEKPVELVGSQQEIVELPAVTYQR
ncbi:hypothetical protein jhhlp_008285 [Lomentospora prolificans]|uniref:Chitin-binding type-1 domain-containing protein n=1 Tax=Lomentospora prolificans TaxID=41688 RepID=A0A2N3MXL0_9PEZI|nr:hypothetical protein jhhlp_008285 [Lomentospora prolificans]